MAHVIATNIIVWFKLILQETFESARNQQGNKQDVDDEFAKSLSQANMRLRLQQFNYNDSLYTLKNDRIADINENVTTIYQIIYNTTKIDACKQVSFQVTDILKNLTPFMHPCSIEYTIICVTMFFMVWYNVGAQRVTTRRYSIVRAQTQIYHLDCNRTLKGLFAGILVFLIGVIIIIMFIASGASTVITSANQGPSLAPQSRALSDDYNQTATSKPLTNNSTKANTTSSGKFTFKILTIFFADGFESFVLLIELVVTIIAYVQLSKLGYARYEHDIKVSLDEAAIVFALSGVLSFCVFRGLAFRFSLRRGVASYFLLVNGIISFLQSLMQTILILEGLRRKSTGSKKPARQLIAFLIMTNISLWLFYSATRNKYANILFKDAQIQFVNMTNFDVSEYLDIKRQGAGSGSVFSAAESDYYRTYYARLEEYSYTSFGGESSKLGQGVGRLSFANPNENAQALKWIIINTISYPLLLYFHFHSSCCLSDIWKRCYASEIE
jgi:hypothetical protein